MLADAYLALTAGQGEIGFDAPGTETTAAVVALAPVAAGGATARPRVLVSAEEMHAHAARLAQLRKKAGGAAVWDRVEEAAGDGMEVAEAAIA